MDIFEYADKAIEQLKQRYGGFVPYKTGWHYWHEVGCWKQWYFPIYISHNMVPA